MAEFEVTGVRWQMGDGLTMEQRTQKAEDFIRTLKAGTPLILAAEPDNPHDNEAIAVYMNYTRRVGYIKHEACKDVKPLLDSDGQCDAVVSGDDGHVTFFVEIPGAPEVVVSPIGATRKLPECPLPQGIGLSFSDEELALQVVAPRLVKLSVSADTVNVLLDMAERYMPLSRLSLCFEDDFWRDHVLKQLRKACRLKLPLPEKERLEQLYKELNDTVGDFHSSHEHWQLRVFNQQLELLLKQAESTDGLFAKYEKYKEDHPDIIESLIRWFASMPYVELCNYEEHESLAKRLSYTRVSRKELYEVYAAILLLNKYGCEKTIHNKSNPKKAQPKTAKPKAKANKKPKTLKYFTHGNNGILMRQRKRVDIVFRKFQEWGWIDQRTSPDDFDAFFEGEPRHCNITWTANGTILTLLLQALLKQPYIEKQTGCAARSLVMQQFGESPSSSRIRLDKVAEERINLTLLILDIYNPLPEPRGRNNADEVDIKDAALKEIFAGQLRSTKGI